MRVFTSEDEESKFVHDEDEGFVASFAYGEWFDHKVVDPRTLKELDQDDDIYEVYMISRQAKRALRYI